MHKFIAECCMVTLSDWAKFGPALHSTIYPGSDVTKIQVCYYAIYLRTIYVKYVCVNVYYIIEPYIIK